jgi:tRNA(Ile)-lysidine synthase
MESVDNIETSFTKVLNKYKAKHYYIAVSGGCDSMVMLSLFQKQKKSFSVLHVNYNLRVPESDKDEALVKSYCATNSIPFQVLNYPLAEDLTNGGNLQNIARTVRYNFFNSHLSKHESAILCLAHHKNDQEESFWMAMARGGGLRAMAGMKVFEQPILRPFLKHTKLALLNYAKIQKIKWREDLSNQTNKYARNIWRNVLIPQLKANNRYVSEAVELLQNHFSSQSIQDSKRVQILIPNHSQNFELSASEVAQLNSNEWIELLDQLNIKKSLALQILSLYQSENGKKIILNNSLCAYAFIWKTSKGLLFEAKKNETEETPFFSVLSCEKLPKEYNKSVLYLDESKIEGTISVRKWKLGDRIHPIGIKGSKLVSDILKDAKVPLHERDNIWLLIDGKKILSLIGYVIDRRAVSKKAPCLKISFESPTD